MADNCLSGLRVMLAEDEYFVAMAVETVLAQQGCVVVGPCEALPRAMDVARTGDFDAAVLDINLNGQLVFPVAEILTERGIPFIFTTGYTHDSMLPEAWRKSPRLTKPYDEGRLVGALRAAACRPA